MLGPATDKQRLRKVAGVSIRHAASRGLSPRNQGNQLAVYRATEDLRHGDTVVRDGVLDAVRFCAGVAVAALVLMAVAEVWIGTCGASTFDALACGTPQTTVLALGAPLILLAGGLRAFHRAHVVRRSHGIAWPWHGAGWFLMAAMLLVLAKSVPLIAMP
jgi:hypothetical protein